MNICLLCYRGNKYCGGQGVYLYYLSRELVRLGHEVDVLVGPPYPDLAEGVGEHRLESLNLYDRRNGRWWELHLPADNPLRVFEPLNLSEVAGTAAGMFPEIVTFSMRAYLKIRQLMPQRRFDIIHDNQCLAFGLLPMKGLGVPLVATIHHPLPIDTRADVAQALSTWARFRRILFYPPLMQGIVARRLDSVITDSNSSIHEIAQAFRVPDERMRLVYPGIDTDVFTMRDGHEGESGRLVMVGRTDDHKKGILYLLQALAILKARGGHYRLTIVDDVNPRDSYALELIGRLGIEEMVTFTGRVSMEGLVHHYHAAEIAVTASTYEGFGFPAAEAMACGVPVIATQVGALPEVVKGEETGLLVPPRDAYALAAAIERLHGDGELRQRLAAAGRRRVERCFSWEQAARQVVDVYQEVLAARGS